MIEYKDCMSEVDYIMNRFDNMEIKDVILIVSQINHNIVTNPKLYEDKRLITEVLKLSIDKTLELEK